MRQLTELDVDAIATFGGDWEVASMTGRIPYPYSPALAMQWLVGLPEGEFVRGIELEGQLIGICGFAPQPDSAAEMGYWIGKPWWGRGFATEAARALMQHCFGEIGYKRLICCHFVGNPASARVIRKLGFRYVGQSKSWCEARQEELDTLRYERRRPLAASWRLRAA